MALVFIGFIATIAINREADSNFQPANNQPQPAPQPQPAAEPIRPEIQAIIDKGKALHKDYKETFNHLFGAIDVCDLEGIITHTEAVGLLNIRTDLLTAEINAILAEINAGRADPLRASEAPGWAELQALIPELSDLADEGKRRADDVKACF